LSVKPVPIPHGDEDSDDGGIASAGVDGGDDETGDDGDEGGGGAAGTSSTSGAGGASSTSAGGGGVCAAITDCQGHIYQCGDTFDNDMDGLIDLDDYECTTPCDDNETYFKTDLPGQNEDCKGDCYFDGNSGSGDDQCEWNLQCDVENPGEQIGCEYDPSHLWCEEKPVTSDVCEAFCEPLVPNGCDCFGCCKIAGQYVYLDGAECALDSLENCESCTWAPQCNNPCDGECEICAGESAADLPPHCTAPSCPNGVTSCTNQSDCAAGQFCSTGCCVDVIPQ
jgi:hypothetical protein